MTFTRSIAAPAGTDNEAAKIADGKIELIFALSSEWGFHGLAYGGGAYDAVVASPTTSAQPTATSQPTTAVPSWTPCTGDDCDVCDASGDRSDCGFFGIDAGGCTRAGCCWGETDNNNGTPWCFDMNAKTVVVPPTSPRPTATARPGPTMEPSPTGNPSNTDDKAGGVPVPPLYYLWFGIGLVVVIAVAAVMMTVAGPGQALVTPASGVVEDEDYDALVDDDIA